MDECVITKEEFCHLDTFIGDDDTIAIDVLDRIAQKIFGQTREQVIDEICDEACGLT